eukprot:237700_1
MDEDEDDDLKITVANTSAEQPVPITERQRKFEKFKQLHQNASSSKQMPNEDGFSKKLSKNQKRSKKSQHKSRNRAKKRSNSLPRATTTTTTNKDKKNTKDKSNKDDYILFHDKTTTESSLTSTSSQFEALNLETSTVNVHNSKQFKFDQLSKASQQGSVEIHTASYRSIRVPGHRMIHVRRLWKDICGPIIKQLKLQIRMNSKKNLIELRMVGGVVADSTLKSKNVIQKGSDFVRAVVLGFEIKDALALLRMEDIFLESFDIRDVKFFNKKSDHWMRAIGRIAGQYGKIKYSIENSTNTRIVIFGFKVHILGSFASIRLARNSISRLVIGSAPGNVYAKLRVVSNRLKHKF